MVNVKICVVCGCTDVPPTELEIPVKHKHIISIKLYGASCRECGEEYYDKQSLKVIEELEREEI
ncbi:YgiT-type zinc finger domain-containing protein [Paenibacillus sp. PvR052]|uniref:YgiT-type zinc finger protein n=1 Tax=unclassified Paenibacillus TaxID=185978 RepID=UPI001AE96565|nr:MULTISPECIES: YgiT-type zinc finger protein [unclassified Paenibacillus]MBP1153938.1 YgiT-type zinc finger domain-containing protein [Paenibacillus sp. PvP091]MBP1170677.1 YgiT-type zinc finger domain-containing protein [Paenibacillus sp. PvR098]MBP2441705.1 YgiT-type zinc finger domain-containing protein [Paenibacillus sp. PvP052]